MPQLRATIALVLGLASLLLRAAEPTPEPAPVVSALHQGTLPNGVRYAILPHAIEPGRVSLRLIVHAGSLDEHDDERGYAHFVEHMAFNGTRHYPSGKLVEFFQRLGLAFGPDFGATTSFTHTTYKLDLPAGHVAQLGEALQVLRDYADGLEFAAGEVRREKGVVLSEQRARNTDHSQMGLQRLATFYAGSLLAARSPGGDPALIERATPDSLRAFYRRCYQPGRMMLLIVGDVAVATATALIAENFATLRTEGPTVAPAEPDLLPASGLNARVIVSPSATAASAALVAVTPRESDTPAGRQAELAGAIVVRLLNRRLIDRRAQAPQRFGGASAFRAAGADERFLHYGLDATAAANDWPAAVALVENELRRAREAGFTVGELREATAVVLAGLRADRDALPGETPDLLANRIAATLISGREWRDAARDLTEAEAFVPQLTPGVASEMLRTLFAEERAHLLLTLRRPPDGGEDAVLAAYRESATHPLPEIASKSADELQFGYVDFGPPGAVATRRAEADLQVELVGFANGARLNLRIDPSEPRHFRLVARIGRGTSDLPRDRPGLGLLAGALLSQSDFNRHTREELGRLIRLRAVSASVNVVNNQFTVTIDGPAAEVPFGFQFLTAFLSDVKLEESRWPRALSGYTALSAGLLGSSSAHAKVDLYFRLSGNDPRFQIPPRATVASYPFDQVASWVRTRWLEGPLEVGLVGDFDAAAAVTAAAASIGTLSTRRDEPPAPDERLTFLTKTFRTLTSRSLPDQAAAVSFAWPAKDAADTRVFCALQLAIDGLVDRLRLKLREELGATYSPDGGVFRESQQRDFAFAYVDLTFAPDKARDLSTRVINIANELARQGLTQEEFSRLREPRRTRTAELLRTNAWWLDEVLLHAQSQPAVLDDARMFATIFAELTLDEVNRAAAIHFRSANTNIIGSVPTAPKAAAPAATSKK